jgi:hypothetical protein
VQRDRLLVVVTPTTAVLIIPAAVVPVDGVPLVDHRGSQSYVLDRRSFHLHDFDARRCDRLHDARLLYDDLGPRLLEDDFALLLHDDFSRPLFHHDDLAPRLANSDLLLVLATVQRQEGGREGGETQRRRNVLKHGETPFISG